MHKRCFKCGEDKPLELFYRHPEMADGRLGKCIACARHDVRANRVVRAEYYAAYDRARQQTLERREQYKERHRRYRSDPVEQTKQKARQAVNNALKGGRLVRRPCACGSGKTDAHHHDYSKPLDVEWLCRRCHARRHQEMLSCPT